MKKKNQKLFIIVGVLLLSVGVSLAYFISNILLNGNGASTKITTASINGAQVKVEGTLNFEVMEMYPGHKDVSGIKVTATGNNELIPYNLIWQGTNTLTTPLNFTVYKTSERIDVTSTCNKKTQIISGAQTLSEECNISNIEKLGTEISSGVINKGDTKVILVKDEFITAYSTGNNAHYYVILEYPNLDEPQNYDLEGLIEGEVTVEESSVKPDINILAAYIAQEDGTYKEVEDIPQSGYLLNEEKSTCSNGTIPGWNTEEHMFYTTNLTKGGTSCYLYFDKLITSEDTLAKLNINPSYIKSGNPDFTKIATGAETVADNGIYKAADPMYKGETYYWRGAATSNHVIFANKCWRIIRINGDGTIRLIYNGVPSGTVPNQTCPGNGSNSGGIAVTSQTYNASYNNSAYVGYTYIASVQRPTPTTGGTASNLKNQTETWYNNNIGNNETYASKVAEGKYCNDRNTGAGYTWAPTGSTFYYAGYDRSGAKSASTVTPTLACEEDVYTLTAGAIIMDEVVMAGGKWVTSNSSYYLYNGQYYWTMSPSYWNGSRAGVFIVHTDGNLNNLAVVNSTTPGIRPVINLRSNVTFNSEADGTQNNPFIVAN